MEVDRNAPLFTDELWAKMRTGTLEHWSGPNFEESFDYKGYRVVRRAGAPDNTAWYAIRTADNWQSQFGRWGKAELLAAIDKQLEKHPLQQSLPV